jgi:hypothetical protein
MNLYDLAYAALTVVIIVAFVVLALALGWLMWHGTTPDPRPDSLRVGNAARTTRRGEAPTGARCTCRLYDQEQVAA